MDANECTPTEGQDSIDSEAAERIAREQLATKVSAQAAPHESDLKTIMENCRKIRTALEAGDRPDPDWFEWAQTGIDQLEDDMDEIHALFDWSDVYSRPRRTGPDRPGSDC